MLYQCQLKHIRVMLLKHLPGLIKFAGDGLNPKLLTSPGVEKSSISLLKRIPVRFPRTNDPNLWTNSKQQQHKYYIVNVFFKGHFTFNTSNFE